MQKLYVVRGNHDGNIGIATNFKSAYECATKYVDSDKMTVDTATGTIEATYSRAQSYCSKWGYVVVYNNNDVTANIEMFHANKY